MKTLFLFLYIVSHPAYEPNVCPPGQTFCYAVNVYPRPAYNEQKYALLESRAAAEEFIKKEGKGGKLVDLRTGKEETIYVQPVLKKVKETVEKEVIDSYEIVQEPSLIESMIGGTITFRGDAITIR